MRLVLLYASQNLSYAVSLGSLECACVHNEVLSDTHMLCVLFAYRTCMLLVDRRLRQGPAVIDSLSRD